mgnify:CR=1 FL=1
MRLRRGASKGCGLFTETIAAIDRTISARLKRNFASFSATCADGIEHLAIAAISAPGVFLPSVAAGFATLRFVRKTFFGEKLLLVGSKGEFLSAIFADDGLVAVH